MHFYGGRSPARFRGMSYPCALADEVDAFPEFIAKEGSVISLVRNRTDAYSGKRKILWTSTPLLKQTSQIEGLYNEGTCEKFYVPCKHCGTMQELVWHKKDEDGYEYGIVWENDAEHNPILETVAYKCCNKECGGYMKNYDKEFIVPKGEWRQTCDKPRSPLVKSFHVTPLYNPPGMLTWEELVTLWAQCWDIGKGRLRDKEKYRLFRNTKQGLTFEEGGVQIDSERVIRFRRTGFITAKVPNDFAVEETGSPVLFVCCSVDVQMDSLFVDVKGYSAGGATWTLDFFEIKGNTAEFNGVWDTLDTILSDRRYIGTDGKIYRILITLIDSGYNTEWVYSFAKKHSRGVYACKGKDWIESGATYSLFSKDALDKIGMELVYYVNTGKLKDKVSNALMTSFWRGGEFQPPWYPNFPEDFRDDYFKMFEAETKVEKRDKITRQFKGYMWKLAFGQPNHAFDTYVYNLAAMEIAAEAFCRGALELPSLDWDIFWAEIKRTGEFYELPATA